jgi:hypothetical protein
MIAVAIRRDCDPKQPAGANKRQFMAARRVRETEIVVPR